MKNNSESLYSSRGPISNLDQSTGPLRVVITGGCGFLGRHIAKSLYNEFKDVRIRLMDLVQADTPVMKFITDGVPLGQPVSFSIVDKDVTRLPHLLRIFKETDVVFHCAASTRYPSGSTKMGLVNIDGTRNVIRACKECGVRVLVYSGSLVQNLKAGVTTQHGISESTWENINERLLIPTLAESMNEAERLVLESCDNSLYTCSIRCPPLYGEFDTHLIPSAMSLANLFYGFYPNCGDPSIRMTAMYAGNAAWAHVCATKRLLDQSTRKAINGRFFYVGDDTPSESYTCFFMRFLVPLGYTNTFHIPMIILEIVLYIIGIVVLLLSVIFDLKSFYFILDYRNQARLFSISHTLVWSKAQLYLGYKPKISFYRAIECSLNNWYRYI